MAIPPIKLVMLKGPREGEALEFRPEITIRLGRLVRGNNLVIKDSGVSSKHLVIEAQSGKWILRDLGSSNGTILNSETIAAKTPFDLRDGDTVKVGEETAFTIMIGGRQEAYSKASEMKCATEEVESRRRNPPRRGKAMNSQTKNSRVLNTETGMLEESKIIDRRVGGRVSRNRKYDDSLDCIGVKEKVADNPEIEAKRGRGRGRPKKGKARQESEEKEMPQVVDKQTHSSEHERIDVEKVQDLVGNVPSGSDTSVLQQVKLEEVNFEEEDEIRLKILQQEEAAGVNPVDQHGGKEEVANEVKKDSASSKVSVDLQKMTLGQWLDYMEVNYPKQIMKETEEMIVEMKKKALKVKEYIIQQKRDKAAAC